MSVSYATIRGFGHYVPERIVKNKEMEQWMDTSDAWISQRSGIRERRFAADDESNADLAAQACRQALTQAGLEIQDIDLIMLATLYTEHAMPGTSFFLQEKLQAGTTPCLDIRVQCGGFIYGMDFAKALVENGQYQNILLVGCELQSRVMNYSNSGRDTAVLFGDGAGAAVISSSANPGIGKFILGADGSEARSLWIPLPGSSQKPVVTAEDIAENKIFPIMDGGKVFKHAVTRLSQLIPEVCRKNDIALDEIQHFVFHQANKRINLSVADHLGIPHEKCFHNLDRYGNCSAASIPIALSEMAEAGMYQDQDKILVAAFGSGFCWGGGIFVHQKS